MSELKIAPNTAGNEIECTECFSLVEIDLAFVRTVKICPVCDEPMRCHGCGADEPENEWQVAPAVGVHGMWCGPACVGRAAMGG